MMTIRRIRIYPDPVLRQKAEPVTEFDEELKKLARDMAETMYAEPGVGLAAPQVGVSKRVITVDVRDEDGKPGELLMLANPEIVERDGEVYYEEGCLSVPGFNAEVRRSYHLVVQAQDMDGNPVEYEVEDFPAVVFQHEIDHLDGILFIDHISPLKRAQIKKRLRKEAQEREASGT